MHVAGKPSWQVIEEAGDLWLHHALFVRDALGLETVGQEVPELLGIVGDRSGLVHDSAIREVSHAWSTWWTDITTSRRVLQSESVSPDDHFEELGFWDEETMPSDPTLRCAIRATQSDVALWLRGQRLEDRDRRRASHPDGRSRLTASAAEATAEQLGVPISDLRASVRIIMVQGIWWECPAPASLLCSPAARDDRDAWSQAVSRTLASSVSAR